MEKLVLIASKEKGLIATSEKEDGLQDIAISDENVKGYISAKEKLRESEELW